MNSSQIASATKKFDNPFVFTMPSLCKLTDTSLQGYFYWRRCNVCKGVGRYTRSTHKGS